MSRVVVRDLALVVTVDPQDTVLRDVSVVVEDGVITAVGPGAGNGAVGSRKDVVIDGRGHLALPGLVNLHTHLPMTLLRGIAEGVDLQGFLARVWAAEGAVMDPETVELGATLGALESLLAGCTTQLDMYFHHEPAHRGAVAAGSRHVGGPTFFFGPGPDGLSWDERIAGLRAWPQVLRGAGGPLVPVAAMPHSTYTCSVEHLAEVARVLTEVADREPNGLAPVLHTHVSENAAENADVVARLGASPTELLVAAGVLGTPNGVTDPARPRVVAGHGVHLSASDRAHLAGSGASVAHCPGSNLKLASGDWTGSAGGRTAYAWGSGPTAARARTTSTCGR
ncbi:amidohydrolase family protein [Knoellia sp. CPCC 206435]|uniref:amidohydrolase family protein n=1 Tax=Knoellia terrae TaxID=3404797 RepID=UPI003B437B79